MDLLLLYRLFQKSTGVSTDTRDIKKESIFFALKGGNFNGNDFALQALEKGAAYAIIDEESARKDERLLLVDDVLQCLQDLANFHRNALGLPVIAITGSNGKTTTKELIRAVISRKFRCCATRGNLNNHIGVPLTLLSMTEETEIGIVEMGANHPGEIDMLCRICQPDYGYITNFGKAHLEGFGNIEGVIAAKSELYLHLKEEGKTLFLNLDDPVQKNQVESSRNFSFGSDLHADVAISYPTGDIYAALKCDGTLIRSKLIGSYNALNMAAAFTIGKFFGIPTEEIRTAIEDYLPSQNRSQVITRNSNMIILDAYNANPTSMAAALSNLENLRDCRKMAILGDMFEIGENSVSEHQVLAERLENSDFEKVYLIGEDFFKTDTNKRIRKFRTFEDFKKEFDPGSIQGFTILIKGSRGMALERVSDLL